MQSPTFQPGSLIAPPEPTGHWPTTTPVSYTHLDVYKRQPHPLQFAATAATLQGSSATSREYSRMPAARGESLRDDSRRRTSSAPSNSGMVPDDVRDAP